jgi:uncharacterized protein (DUF2267 family)
MNEIVQMVAQKTGIGEDKARQAVQLVLEHLKGRLPGPIASHLDGILQGNATGSEPGGGGLGNLLGKVG